MVLVSAGANIAVLDRDPNGAAGHGPGWSSA